MADVAMKPRSDRAAPGAADHIVLPVTRYHQNCSLVPCGGGAAIAIDPGGDVDRLLAEAALRHWRIAHILLTHGHADHAGAAAELAARTGASIRGPHRDDFFLLDRLGDPAWTDAIAWLEDGDILHAGSLTLDVRHCPGHTPGHLAFIDRIGRRAWVGDILFAGTIGSWDTPYGDGRQLITSIVERLWPFGDDIRFVPGHGQGSTFGIERQFNAFVSDICAEELGLDPGPDRPRQP